MPTFFLPPQTTDDASSKLFVEKRNNKQTYQALSNERIYVFDGNTILGTQIVRIFAFWVIFMTIEFKPVLFQIKPTQRAGDVSKDTLRLEPVVKSSFSLSTKQE